MLVEATKCHEALDDCTGLRLETLPMIVTNRGSFVLQKEWSGPVVAAVKLALASASNVRTPESID